MKDKRNMSTYRAKLVTAAEAKVKYDKACDALNAEIAFLINVKDVDDLLEMADEVGPVSYKSARRIYEFVDRRWSEY